MPSHAFLKGCEKMKTITIDVIKGTADVHAVEGDVGVKVIITNTPQEWKNCTVFALITQDSASHHTKVINNEFDVPSAFTDANKAFKIGVYAVGADGSRDVRPSIWIRVESSDFTTDDIEITLQNIGDILDLQAQYTKCEKAEEARAKAEEVRQENESARIEAENNRKTELIDIKTRLSDAETDIDNLENGKVEKIENSDTVNLIYAESPDGKGTKSVRNTQGASPKSIPIRGSNGELIVRKNPSIPDEAVSKEFVETAIANKVDKVEGYQLSQNNFSDNECMKLIGIEDNAQKNVQSDWNTSDTKSDAYIKNKPVIDQTYKSESKNAQSGKAVAEAIAKLVDGSPEALDTLFELANALGNDKNFATKVMDAIGKKVDKINGYGLVNVDYSFSLDNPEASIVLKINNYGGSPEEIEFFSKETSERLFSSKADVAYVENFKEQLRIGQFPVEYATNADYAYFDFHGRAITETYAEKTEVFNQFPDDDIPVPNTEYILGIISDLAIRLPITANKGDVVYINFISGEDPTTLTIDTTYAYDFELIPEPKMVYEIFGKYNGRKWMLAYAEYNISDDDLI